MNHKNKNSDKDKNTLHLSVHLECQFVISSDEF